MSSDEFLEQLRRAVRNGSSLSTTRSTQADRRLSLQPKPMGGGVAMEKSDANPIDPVQRLREAPGCHAKAKAKGAGEAGE